MLPLCNDLRRNRDYYLLFLLLVSVVSHFPFVLNGFGELDATRIGVSVIDIIKHGSKGAFINYYFNDVIPLYILYLKLFMKFIDYDFSLLPIVMNYTNAVFGTLTVIPAFLLIERLFKSPSIAFCTVLALIFVPSFYQSTISGFPHLLALFFLLLSLLSYLSALDSKQDGIMYLRMLLATLFFTTSLLLKSDYVLSAGVFAGILFVRKIKDKQKVSSAFLIVIISGILFLVIRHLIIGQGSGATNSVTGFSEWYRTFFPGITSLASLPHLKRQIKPLIFGIGVITFFLVIISFAYFLIKRRFNILCFTLSWAALPTIIWMIIHGNNARHNMLSALPFLIMIMMFFYEKAHRYILILTISLILGNYFITSPSSSILTPSGNLFKSNTLLKQRTAAFHSRAKEIININEERIAVMGYFHNPYVVYELLSSVDSYEAIKIGREDYRIRAGNKEYMVFYVDITDPRASIESLLARFDIKDYLFVSVIHDLRWLEDRGFKVRYIEPLNIKL